MSVRKTILGILFGKAAQAASRIITVPIIISTLGPAAYGEWLLYSSITGWIMMSNMGVGSHIANEMSLKYFAGSLDGARESYTYGLHISAGILFFVALISVIASVGLVSLEVVNVPEATAIVLLSVSVPVSFFAEIFGARLRLVNKNHIGGVLSGVRAWAEPLLMLLLLFVAKNIISLAFAVFLSTLLHVALTFGIARALEQACHRKKIQPPISSYLQVIKSGMGFMAFPLGNAFVFQGSLMMIGAVLGPVAVAVYGTTRTAARVVNQLLEILNQAIWPQLTMLYAEGRNQELVRLWTRATLASGAVALVAAVAFATFGPDLYRWWVRSSIEPNKTLFNVFAAGVPLCAIWSSAGVLLLAINKQSTYGYFYFAGSALFMLLAYLLLVASGLVGVAIASVTLDALMVIATIILVARLFKNKSWLVAQPNISTNSHP